MAVNMFANFIPFCFSLVFVSLALTKAVHLFIHAKTVSPLAFAFYLPSLLLPDVLVICLARLVLQRRLGVAAMTACVVACNFSFVILGAASSTLGFFYETGNEVEWSDAAGYVGESDGLKILLSGLRSVLTAGTFIVVISWFAKMYLYRGVAVFSLWLAAPFVAAFSKIRSNRPKSVSDWTDSDDEEDVEEGKALVYGKTEERALGRKTSSLIFAGITFVGLTTIFRPHAPYTLMSATLPYSMMEMFQSTPDLCAEQAAHGGNAFPFPDLINRTNWEMPNGHFKGWAPGSNNKFVQQYRDTTPDWLPEELGTGFQKWAPKSVDRHDAKKEAVAKDGCLGAEADGTFYNPVDDPLKISNLNDDILDVLKTAIDKEDVKIKHVALIMMESYREELFPLEMGSPYHKFIMSSHEKPNVDEINGRLARMSPVAQRITGKSGNWKKKDGSDFGPVATPSWNDTTRDGYGGINVVGGFTTSSLSFKSMAAIHCGAWPMPVDNFEEAETQAYQPCLPQILDTLNRIKDNATTSDFLEQQWLPAFFQSITDGYDRQKKFDKHIGFKHVVTKSRLDRDGGQELEEINYFGYPETTLKGHLKEYLQTVQAEGKRMFLSHFTSTTHHPWGVPKDFKQDDYMGPSHRDFNNYLNAIRFTDAWLGEMLQALDDQGMANETLVVFVGDHGQAFKEDVSKTGTYENGHVSNFRVPITFRHPNLPRVQYQANATSLSILPTILDLLINTGSLNDKDTSAMSELVQDYEGQSLIRPYKKSDHGRRAWNFGVINGGGRMLSMTSADAPWRLVIPLDEKSEYRFTDLANDPLELKPYEDWTKQSLIDTVKQKYGKEAGQWVTEAEAIGRWWGLERKRLWGYRSGGGDHDKESD